jgi:hypothetical protein
MSLGDCIKAAGDDGVISKGDARELLRRLARAAEAAKGDPSAARMRLVMDLEAEGVEARRRSLLTVKASDAIRRDVTGYRGADGKPDIAEGILRLFEHVGHTGYSSVKGIADALTSQATTGTEFALHAFRRSGLTMRRVNKLVMPEIVRAAWGQSKSEQAKAFYAAWRSQAERLRLLFNQAGGAIGWREDYGLPTWHDGIAVQRVGFDAWRKFIAPRLDWEKMRNPLSGERIAEGDRDASLRHVWESIVTDGWNTREPSRSGGAGASLALSRQDPRFLVFRNADGWSEYSKAFGRGDVQDVMFGHIRSMARDVALMQRLGPNPSATVQWLKQIIAQEAGFAKAGEESLYRRGAMTRLGDAIASSSTDVAVAHRQSLVDSLYEIARGASQPRGLLAKALTADANEQMGAKLGSAPITHAMLNPIVLANASLHYGVGMGKTLATILRGFSGQSGRELARSGMIVQDAMHSLESGAREAGLFNRMVEASKWLPAITTHFSGLEGGVQALRRAWWWSTSATIASHLGKAWEQVPLRVRDLMSGFGINEADWKVMQAAEVYEPAAGAPFLRWQEIAAADRQKVLDAKGRTGDPVADAAAAPEMANETAMKYLEMLNASMEFAVPSSRWRGRAIMTMGTKNGSTANLLLRSPAMFKGFVASMTISYLEALRRELSRSVAVGASAAAANAIVLGLMGTAVLQLKNLSTGKDARPIDPRTADGRSTLLHGLMTSGAMSIYGDFLASDHSSYGHDLLAELAGPIVTGGVDAIAAAKDAGQKLYSEATGAKTKPVDAEGGFVKFLHNNTPVLSTHWALRAAYQRILLDQLQYLAEPDAQSKFRRLEASVARDTGQRFWWRPGEIAPERFPQLTQGRN